MNAWDEILIALGGNATLLIVLGFLARSLLQTWLTKDIKKFETDLKTTADSELERLKAELKAQGEISIEQLKSHLQQTVFEHQVRFSKLHEKRGEVIEEVYQQFVGAEKDFGQFIFVDTYTNDVEQGSQIETKMRDLSLFIEKHRIYLPDTVCELLKTFSETMWNNVINVRAHTFTHPTAKTALDKNAALRKAYEALRKEIPSAKAALIDEFRTILGVEKVK